MNDDLRRKYREACPAFGVEDGECGWDGTAEECIACAERAPGRYEACEAECRKFRAGQKTEAAEAPREEEKTMDERQEIVPNEKSQGNDKKMTEVAATAQVLMGLTEPTALADIQARVSELYGGKAAGISMLCSFALAIGMLRKEGRKYLTTH